MYVIEGKRVKIRQLKLHDVYHMQKWGRHENPLYYNYNFPKLSNDEVMLWYRLKTKKKNTKCYVVFNEEDILIGYMTLKNIKRIKKCATLGIVIDYNYMNNGYGTEAIQILLKHFFHNLRMETMYLKVEKYNTRALRCYEKSGFTKIKRYMQKLNIEGINRDIDQLLDLSTELYFHKHKNQLYSQIYKMKIEKKNMIVQ